MHAIHMLPFKKGFFEVPNKTCFVFALTHQKPKAFKYDYLSKVKAQKATRNEAGKFDFTAKRSSKI